MHPNNRLINGYHFETLLKEFPALAAFAITNEHDKLSLDFSQRTCIIGLNKALLKKYYNVEHWKVPGQHLCPTVPGRADYLHYLSDIINVNEARILDIGTGASVIYPLLGNMIFNWQFVGTDIDPRSLACAQGILNQNKIDKERIELRLQTHREFYFKNVVHPKEQFDACICNPPFFESIEQADSWSRKKWNTSENASTGSHSELATVGGEKTFIINMIKESVAFEKQFKYFTCLVSKKSTIPFIEKACKENDISNLNFIEMQTGRKVSRIAVWRF